MSVISNLWPIIESSDEKRERETLYKRPEIPLTGDRVRQGKAVYKSEGIDKCVKRQTNKNAIRQREKYTDDQRNRQTNKWTNIKDKNILKTKVFYIHTLLKTDNQTNTYRQK